MVVVGAVLNTIMLLTFLAISYSSLQQFINKDSIYNSYSVDNSTEVLQVIIFPLLLIIINYIPIISFIKKRKNKHL
jgi:multisubunit Na+/H+ antiporter MnhB subunit